MQTKLFVSTAAIAYLVAGLGTASAGDVFATLEGVSASAMSAPAMHGVRGSKFVLEIFPDGAPGMSPVVGFDLMVVPLVSEGVLFGLDKAGTSSGSVIRLNIS